MTSLQVTLLTYGILLQTQTSICQTDGEMRLARKKTSSFVVKGRVEIFHNGRWGTICDDGFGDSEAQVVCRQLNESLNGAFSFTEGRGSGTIWLDDVSCQGPERFLKDCSHEGWAVENCAHSEDVGVSCVKNGAIRLASRSQTSTSVSGRLEILHNDVWGTVCLSKFDANSAAVVCRQLGENFVNSVSYKSTSEGSGKIWLTNVTCFGTETSLTDCSHSDWDHTNCTHKDEVGITCYNGTEGAVRLASNLSSGNVISGRLEIFHRGQWGTVCKHGFDNVDAMVVCGQIGIRAKSSASFNINRGSGHIWLNNVDCKGTETSLSACSHSNWEDNNCSHYDDVGISCFNRSLSNMEGTVRLAESITSRYSIRGRVEIYLFGEWGTICDDGFDNKDALVVCRQLGRNFHGAYSYTAGGGNGTIWLYNVRCKGSEDYLTQCSHPAWGSKNCGHGEDVGVVCVKEGAIRLVDQSTTSTSVKGRLEIFHNEEWGTVCSSQFSTTSAAVVCRQLGKNARYSLSYTSENEGSGKIWLTDVICFGTETSLTECIHSDWERNSCMHKDDVGIICYNGTEGAVRLAGNKTTRYAIFGRLEVYHHGEWGTVCNNGFDNADAKVACKQFGISSVYSTSYTTRRTGSGKIWLSNIGCYGTETSLTDCSHSHWESHICTHNDDVGISCVKSMNIVMEGDIRLAENTSTLYSISGRLEVYRFGEWGTVCDDGFDNKDAMVVCSQIGKTTKTSFGAYSFNGKAGTGQIWLDDVSCIGSENYLKNCSHDGWGYHNCGHNEDISVGCVEEGAIRLADQSRTSDSIYGRLEIFYNDVWGTICSNQFSINSAIVVCRQIGHNSVYSASYSNGNGEGIILLTSVVCDGTESSLTACSYEVGNVSCTHKDDVVVSCFNSTDVEVKLIERISTSAYVKGILEVRYGGIWGTICNNQFDRAAANVVCKQLGVRTGFATSYTTMDSRAGKTLSLTNLVCNGNESSLSSCSHFGWGNNICTQREILGISCFTETEVDADWSFFQESENKKNNTTSKDNRVCGHPTPGNYAVIAGVATGCGILSAAIALVVVHFVLRFKRQQQEKTENNTNEYDVTFRRGSIPNEQYELLSVKP